jgi:DNA polymerase III alpha subunit
MNYDQFGQCYVSQQDLVDILYANPNCEIDQFVVTDPDSYNNSIRDLNLDLPLLKSYQAKNITIEEFDQLNQSNWFMPDSYKNLDIAKWLLDQCRTDAELQRVGDELLRYQDRNLFDLLKYLKYLVDTLRENNIVWGVGRGSSVASYVLYLIGIHKINSIYYDLDITEFLKD